MTDIGLIGCGRWGANILRDLVALGARVHVARLGTEHDGRIEGAASLCRESAELPPVEGYVVATPASSHAEIIEGLLASGRPIFVEKPMTSSLSDARHLVAIAGERIFVMDKWRYHAGIERLRCEIEAGAIGRPLAIRLFRWSVGDTQADVSPIWTLAPHDLSIILHLLGEIPPIGYAHPLLATKPTLGFVAGLAGESGPAVTLDVGVLGGGHHRRITVIGSDGLLELGGRDAGQLTRWDGAPGSPRSPGVVVPFTANMPLEAELRTFLAYIAGSGPPPLSPARDGLRVVERLVQLERLVEAG